VYYIPALNVTERICAVL